MKKYIPIVLILSGFAAFFALGGHHYLNLQTLADERQTLLDLVQNHKIGAIAAYLGIYAVATALSLPGGLFLTLAGGFMFGTWLGGFLTVFAATLGAAGIFLAARTAFGEALKQKAGKRIQKMQDGFKNNALSYLLVLRLVPLFPFWLVNIAPAFLGVNLRTYIIGTFFGIIPGTFVYASVGNGLGTVLDAGKNPNLGIIFEPAVLLPILALAALSLIPTIYKKVKNKS